MQSRRLGAARHRRSSTWCAAHWLRFQVLKERAERLAQVGHEVECVPYIWMGVSVESDQYRDPETGASDLFALALLMALSKFTQRDEQKTSMDLDSIHVDSLRFRTVNPAE